MNKFKGFTLIELMVTVAVAAILLSIAVPGFSSLMSRNASMAQANYFSTAVALAKAEAVKRNQRAYICTSKGSASCDSSGGWAQGWLVYADADGDGSFDDGEAVRVFDALDVGFSVTAGVAALKQIGFTSEGMLYSAGGVTNATFYMCGPDQNVNNGRTLNMNITGRFNISQGVPRC